MWAERDGDCAGDCADVEREDEAREADADDDREAVDDERADGESWVDSRRAIRASLMAAFFALPVALDDFLFGLSGIFPPVVVFCGLWMHLMRLIPISAG
ncbi:hypothetical protein GCM10009555_039670 [Acrocarpospora macrocephala]|uniref:hypothetical protein n=1 Tax=Acrocarpospora macrocephala TaxID=150177 RepID=UPI0012D2EDC4|nr:hypothetical protein [Acrocarpospora macrocephala]